MSAGVERGKEARKTTVEEGLDRASLSHMLKHIEPHSEVVESAGYAQFLARSNGVSKEMNESGKFGQMLA